MTKTKIIIAGIGGVGGYFGGLLAKHFNSSTQVEIIFFARGENLNAIKNNGLKVIKGSNEFICKPTLITDEPAEIGIADIIIISTKTYDLETVTQQLQPCINKNTLILPLLNGVDSSEKIKNLFPGNTVLQGCVYIVARLKQPGVVENIGNIQTLYFGSDTMPDERLQNLENLFKEAGIEATLSKNISTVMWEKFIFISPTATTTSYYNKSIGEVLSDPESLATLTSLIEEIKQAAKAKQVTFSEGIAEKTVDKLKSMPFEATSSMHTDFKMNKAKNELQSLTGYVLAEGKKYHLETPTYLKSYTALQKRHRIT